MQKKIIGLKNYIIKGEKKKKARRKKKKKDNSTELQKPSVEAEVYNNSRKYD